MCESTHKDKPRSSDNHKRPAPCPRHPSHPPTSLPPPPPRPRPRPRRDPLRRRGLHRPRIRRLRHGGPLRARWGGMMMMARVDDADWLLVGMGVGIGTAF